ncbi:MAG: hypothetical protein KDA32_02860 [Phycisphaerales bacterium]|nr:hypothetical protein [Phycisphaerales bacterium]
MLRSILKSAPMLGALAGVAVAAPVLDGTRDAAYGAPLAVQSVETQFGDNFSELDAGYARIEAGTLYVMLTGNLENNFNKLNIFIDSVAGGQNVLTSSNPSNDGWAGKHAGMRFDASFAADYMLILRNGNAGGDRFDIDFAIVGGAAGDFEAAGDVFGGSQQGSNASALPGVGIGVAFNNSNAAGVLGGTGAADPVAAAAVTTGVELAIPLSAIGSPVGDIKISAMVNGSNPDYLSNQFLGGLPAGTGNLGGDGNGNFTGSLSGINLNNFAGNQYFTIPEPASLSYLALAGLLAIRRR